MPNLNSILASEASTGHNTGAASPRQATKKIADITLGDTANAEDSRIAGTEQVTLIGVPGSGASALQDSLIGQLIPQGAYILLDAAADYDRLDRLTKRHQRVNTSAEFQVLNFDKPDQSNTYNPLARGAANVVAKRIMSALTNQAYAKWRLSDADFSLAVSFVTVLVQALRDRDGVAQFNRLDVALNSQDGFDALVSSPHITPATRAEISQCFNDYRNPGAGDHSYNLDEIRKPLATLLHILPKVATGPIGSVLNVAEPDIDLIDGLRTRKGLLVMLPLLNKDGVALALGRLIFADICDGLEEQQHLANNTDQPLAVLMTTETPCLSTDNLMRTFVAAKAAGVGVLAGLSSIRNLNKFSLMDQQALLNNEAIKIFLKSKPSTTPDVLSEFSRTLAAAGVSRTLAELTAELGEDSVGEGVIARDEKVVKLTLWPVHPVRIMSREEYKKSRYLERD